MSAEASRGNVSPGKKKTRKHSIKQFVFSTTNNETQQPSRDGHPSVSHRRRTKPKGIDQAFLNRYGRLEHILTHPQHERVCFIHNHKIVRAVKVYVNVYHLWRRWINRTLRTVGLGGGYHTSIEVFGREFHFGCCSQIDAGIFESEPLHHIRESPVADDNFPKSVTLGEETWIGMEMASQMGPLKARYVIGLWSGSQADFEILLRHLKEEGNWRGLNYRLLSFNCNHFVRDACDTLLRHSKHFHPARGMTSSDSMVPSYLFKLTSFFKSRYLACVIGGLDEEEVAPSIEEEFAFRGRARFVNPLGACIHHTTSFFEIGANCPVEAVPPRERRQSLPELRDMRIRALEHRAERREMRRSTSTRRDYTPTSVDKDWRYTSSPMSLLHTDSCERTTWGRLEQSALLSTSDLDEHLPGSERYSRSAVLIDNSISLKAEEILVQPRTIPSGTRAVRSSGYRTDERQARPRRSSSLHFIDPPASAAPSPRASGMGRSPQRQKSNRKEKNYSVLLQSDPSSLNPALFATGASFGEICEEERSTVSPTLTKRQEEMNLRLLTRSLQ